MLEHVKCETPDLAKANLEKLKALFPGAVTEGPNGVSVDVEALKQECSATPIEGNVERYEFTWPGKRAAKAAASAASTKTLRPCREESVDFDKTENLYIEGDNLEVLKLLQKNYANQVKMIYIDPPYNTGHDFVYRDRFSLTQKELENDAGTFDEEGNRFEVNDTAEARYHSNWCSMMYPRLRLARNLLRNDGVLFVSIDDNEVVNARKLCEEVFGESQFVAQFTWISKSGGGGDNKSVVDDQEYVLCFAKSLSSEIQSVNRIEVKAEPLDKVDELGPYRVGRELNKWGANSRREDRPTMYFPIPGPHGEDVYPIRNDGSEGCWRWGKPAMLDAVANGNCLFHSRGDGTYIVYEKVRSLESRYLPHRSFLEDVGFTSDGSMAVTELFGRKVFDFCKPVKLLVKLLEIGLGKEDIIVDFFSGSATTAHAVMQLNAEDGGHRKFIMVQLPEPCAEDSEAAKADFKNICEIGKERIRRAGKKIAEENATTVPDLDIGFRVLKLDSSSLNDTSATVSETDQKFENFDRIKDGRSSEDLLFQMLLETHIPLSDKIEKKTVGGNEVFYVSGTALVACLDAKAKMTTDFFIEIAKLKPGIAFFRDDAFADDSARTNLQQAFDQFSPSTAIKVI